MVTRRRAKLTPTQRDLYLYDLIHPGSTMFNVGMSVNLGTGLDPRLWEAAVRWAAARDDMAETRILSEAGEPFQEVDPHASVHFEPCKLDATFETAEQYLWKQNGVPFDLETSPAWRNYLVEDADGRYTAALLCPHILLDGFGVGGFIGRVATAYEAMREGREPPEARFPSYYDYATDDCPVFDRPETENYWAEQLRNAAATDFPANLGSAADSRLERLEIAPQEAGEIRAFCERHGYRLPALFMTAYALLLQRYTGADDLAVLSIFQGRPEKYRETLGCFYQVLPYVLPEEECRADRPVVDLVGYVMQYRRGLPPDCEISTALVNRLLRNPKLKCFYNYQSFTDVVLLGERRTYETYISHPDDEVNLAVTDMDGSIRLEFYYNERALPYLDFLERLRRLVLQVCRSKPTLGDLSILLEGEQAALVGPETLAPSAPAPAANVHQRFEAQAALHPDRVALTFPVVAEGSSAQSLGYEELNERANQLAHHLQGLGVGPGTLVPVCLERSLDLVAAILGIVKAGGAYVPLDPDYPQERLDFVLEDTGAAYVVTQAALAGRFPRNECRTVCMDADAQAICANPTQNPVSGVGADDLAYVIYTSGSTGRPKGVLVSHANVALLFRQTQNWFGFGPADVWTLFHSSAFDFSVWELWGALIHGGRLVVVPKTVARSPEAFYQLLDRERVTVLNQTPSAFYHLIRVDEALPAAAPLALRYVVFGGERLELRALESWVDRHGDRSPRLINMYGITETTVHVTYRPIFRDDIESDLGSVVGVPIPGLQIYLLDKQQRPVPDGLVGEIYVRGGGVARGYLNRPELTRERFVPDPFDPDPDARMYRSGDLGRRRPDGDLEYIGRADDQVKIRGFRIEPGEIETTLARHAGIAQAAVVAQEHARRLMGGEVGVPEQRLVAYVVRRAGPDSSVSELRAHLGTQLPEYMIPAAFVFLDRLPLTPNGKLDRRALPGVGTARPEIDEGLVAPSTPTERDLAAIFAQVLGLERVGVHDDFFHLGGHSLAATQLVSGVRQALQADLRLCKVFETPTVAELANCLEPPESGSEILAPQIKPVPRDGPLPVSFAQERVCFLLELEPGNRAYEFVSILRFKGRLVVEVLERCLQELVRRHEIYRTTFGEVDGRTHQFVHEPWQVSLEVNDLGSFSTEEREAEAQKRIHELAEQPYELGRLPLARWKLLRLDEEHHILVHCEHHLIHDGWSFVLLLQELLTLYEAFFEGKSSPLPELPLQFADYAYWQREWFASGMGEAQLDYWKTKLADAPRLLELPLDHPRPVRQQFRGDSIRFDFSPEMSRSIESVGRENGVTAYMATLAAFFGLLFRLSGQEDISVGAGIANRRWRETENLLGMIINNVVLRCDLSGAPTFRELMHRVREVALEAYEHQDVPFDKVVEAVNPPRSASYSPIFQVAFSSYDGFMPSLRLPGLSIELEEGLSNGSAKFDLNVISVTRSRRSAEDGGGENISMIWEYNTDLFDRESVERMVGYYRAMLERLIADSEQGILDFPLPSESEQRVALEAWNDTRTDYPRDSCIQERFEAQARRNPAAIAAVLGDRELSYGELNRRANQLAHHLRRLDVGPEVLVGLCVERSFEMLVGMLGILKAGGAYVPLDPEYPRERLAFMLDDTQAPVLLTQARLAGRLPAYGPKLVCLDSDWEVIGRSAEDDPERSVKAENLAYVMYTSGSTGQPKGTTIPHRGVLRLVQGNDYARLGPDEVVLQLAPVSFDASTFEIWGALLNGSRLVLFPGAMPSLEELGRVVRESGVTTMWLTAGLFHQMVESQLESLRGVRQLLAGGDVLSASHVRKVLEGLPGCRLINGYGPTENTTFTCCHPMTHADQVGESVSIGRPIANTRVYLLDSRLQPVPIGVPGELYTGGDGLARSYLNHPELTAERFVPDPFSGEPGARLYRTGDRARYRPDGSIEFLGRIDQQVKVRGFRVEPGEVETILAALPAVKETVVVAREDVPGDERLVAYVVHGAGRAPQPNELRLALSEKLPGYMVPGTFVFLDALPLTPNGKVDRRALPPPPAARRELESGFVAPRTSDERVLAGIWCEVLRVEQVGVHDNFFDLGGHSLLATQILSRLRAALGVEFPMRCLFEAPTVAGLAATFSEAGATSSAGQTSAIERLARVPRSSPRAKKPSG